MMRSIYHSERRGEGGMLIVQARAAHPSNETTDGHGQGSHVEIRREESGRPGEQHRLRAF